MKNSVKILSGILDANCLLVAVSSGSPLEFPWWAAPHTRYSLCELQVQCWLDLLLHSGLEQGRSSRKNSAWCTDKTTQRAVSGQFLSFDCVTSPMIPPWHLSLILGSHLYLVNICAVTCPNSCWDCRAGGPVPDVPGVSFAFPWGNYHRLPYSSQ